MRRDKSCYRICQGRACCFSMVFLGCLNVLWMDWRMIFLKQEVRLENKALLSNQFKKNQIALLGFLEQMQMPPTQPWAPPPQSYPPNAPAGLGYVSNPHFIPPSRQFDNYYHLGYASFRKASSRYIFLWKRSPDAFISSGQSAPSIITQITQQTNANSVIVCLCCDGLQIQIGDKTIS